MICCSAPAKYRLAPVFCCRLPAELARLQLSFNVSAANQVSAAALRATAINCRPRASRIIFI
ncbi:hypothetical protein [Methanimicrococcus hongohii]|uniref:hypothetical protein n=1 Tax=Methanimicrococcus hongohii TaxID=3028295 RepID=UPI00292F599B|nr:hypothetical protein [Methanimicrococcus sp. Hf6]